jgi:hypothetical protein
MPIVRFITTSVKDDKRQRKILVKYQERRTDRRWKHAGTLFVPRRVAYVIQDIVAATAGPADDVTTNG